MAAPQRSRHESRAKESSSGQPAADGPPQPPVPLAPPELSHFVSAISRFRAVRFPYRPFITRVITPTSYIQSSIDKSIPIRHHRPPTLNLMSETVIREVTPNIVIFSKPFARLRLFPVGGRSTAIRLESGDVWVLASTPLTDETKAKLNELGPVKYLIGASAAHHLFLADYKKEYAGAKVIGVAPLVAKKKGVIQFDGVYGRDPPETKYGYESEIQACYFSGFQNQDVAFFHAPSKSLIQADLLFNLPGKEQYSKSKSSGKLPFFSSLGPMMRSHKTAMSRDAKTVAGWDFDRVIPCHGDVIETGGKAAWMEAYQWYLEEDFET